MKTDEEIISEWWKLIDTDSELRSAIRLYRMAERSRKPNYCDMEKAAYENHKAHHPDGTTHVCYFCECEEQARADERRKCEKEKLEAVAMVSEMVQVEAYAKGKAEGCQCGFGGCKEPAVICNKHLSERISDMANRKQREGREEGISAVEKELIENHEGLTEPEMEAFAAARKGGKR